jgi:hypothetical protein
MKAISHWASQHRIVARWLIAACYFSANIVGLCWTATLLAEARKPAMLLSVGLLCVMVAAMLIHPRKWRRKSISYSFARHKACDLVICFSTVALVAVFHANPGGFAPQASARIEYKRSVPDPLQARDAGASVMEKRAGHLLRKAAHWYRGMQTWQKAVTVACLIIATVILCFFWAGICCSLACDGLEGLAVVLGIVGISGLIVGCVLLCRRVLRGPRFRGPRPVQ